MILRYIHLVITAILFHFLFLLLNESRWRPSLMCRLLLINTLIMSSTTIHLLILTVDIWWRNVHFLVNIVLLLCRILIIICKSATSSLEEPLLVNWINNIFQEVLRILWKCIIGTWFLLVHLLTHLLHSCIWVMKLLIENLSKTLRSSITHWWRQLLLLLGLLWNLLTSGM